MGRLRAAVVWAAVVPALFVLIAPSSSPAVAEDSHTDSLDRTLEWQVGKLTLVGNHALSRSALHGVIETKPRSRLRFWRARPIFDVIVLERDLERVERLYETEGYYETTVDWQLTSRKTAKAEILGVEIQIVEGPRAFVTGIEIDPPDPELTPGTEPAATTAVTSQSTPRRWALEVGDPFREADYQRLEVQLRAIWLDRGFASVATKRSAKIRPDREGVAIRYEIAPGPPGRFGSVTIEGLDKIDERIVTRELTFQAGDTFSISRIEESRRRLALLDLFTSIELDWQTDPASPAVAPVKIVLREKKPRELRIGGGYSTEERGRAQIRWQNRNWLGGGRRLLVSGRYSNIVRSAEISFVQPHVFDRKNRGLFDFSLFQEDEPNFTRNSIQGVPGLDRAFTPKLTGIAGLRVETAEVRDVEEEVKDRIGGVRDEGTVIGPRFSLRWTPVDDVARPRNGLVAAFDAQYSSRQFGASYDYVRLVGEVSVFKSILDYAVVAGRLKLGAAQAFGGKERLPIFERLYAGGEGSVRGYRRHQLGPTAGNGNPLGGRSLIEGSIETRIPVWRQIGAVAFLDFGQVSLDLYDFVPDDLRFAAGPGLSYATPIGPISLFAGFPINRQSGEPPWQMHFNIGFFF